MEDQKHDITQQITNRLIRASVQQGLELLAIYLFGSFGTQHFRRESDIDIGVLAIQPLSTENTMRLMMALDQPGGHIVDLVDLQTTDLEMQDIVISERRKIDTNPDAIEKVEDYEHRVWVTYITLCEDRKPIMDEIKRTGVIYGPDYIPKGRIRKPVHKTH